MNEEKNRLLEDLYQKYYDAVFRWCFQEVHFQACYIPLIEDCIHDAFRKAIVCYEEYKDYMNPMGWIAKAARNCFLSELRKQKNRSSQASLKKIVTEQAMSRDLYLSDFERWLEQEECKNWTRFLRFSLIKNVLYLMLILEITLQYHKPLNRLDYQMAL